MRRMEGAAARMGAEQPRPDDEKKPRFDIDQEAAKVESREQGPDFGQDVESFLRVQESYFKKQDEIAALEAQKKGGDLSQLPQGERGIDSAIATLRSEQADLMKREADLVEKYGDKGNDFTLDALTIEDRLDKMEEKKKQLAELQTKLDRKETFPKGERLTQLEAKWLQEEIDGLKAEIKGVYDKYSKRESEARADLAAIDDEQIKDFVENAFNEWQPSAADILKDVDVDKMFADWKTPALEGAAEGEGKASPEQDKEKAKIFEAAVKDARDLDALKALVASFGTIEGSSRPYSADEVNKAIDEARSFPVLLGNVTRMHGLREKVGALIKKEREAGIVELTPAMRKKKPEAAPKAKGPEDEKEWEMGKLADTPEEQWFFKEGEAMDAAHARGEAFETIEVMDDWLIDDAPSKEEVKNVLEKNELSPERREKVEQEIAELETDIMMLEDGHREQELNFDGDIVKDVAHPGLRDLENRLCEMLGLDLKDPEKAREALETMLAEKTVSTKMSLKLGLKSLFSGEFRRTLKEYEELSRQWADKKEMLKKAKWELEDPKGYAQHQAKMAMKFSLLRLKQARQPKSSGGPFVMRFPS